MSANGRRIADRRGLNSGLRLEWLWSFTWDTDPVRRKTRLAVPGDDRRHSTRNSSLTLPVGLGPLMLSAVRVAASS